MRQLAFSLRSVGERELLHGLEQLVRRERRVTAELLVHIEETDRRQLWAKHGFPSMFAMCVERYHMSESQAGKRIGAARMARRFPILFDMVAAGEIHLSGITRLKSHLTEENHSEVLARATRKSVREVDLLIAELWPQPDVQSSLRAVRQHPAIQTPTPPSATEPLAGLAPSDFSSNPPEEPRGDDRPASTTVAAARPRSPDPTPLSPRRYKLTITLDEDAHTDLRQLQDLLAHQVPNGDPGAIVSRALSSYREQTMKRRMALTDRPREPKSESSHSSRSVPAHLKRAVWKRDGDRCAFVSEQGRRCNETRALELAHAHPWARGGEHSLDNLALRCRAHNRYEAIVEYGEDFMAEKSRGLHESAGDYARVAGACTTPALSPGTVLESSSGTEGGNISLMPGSDRAWGLIGGTSRCCASTSHVPRAGPGWTAMARCGSATNARATSTTSPA